MDFAFFDAKMTTSGRRIAISTVTQTRPSACARPCSRLSGRCQRGAEGVAWPVRDRPGKIGFLDAKIVHETVVVLLY